MSNSHSHVIFANEGPVAKFNPNFGTLPVANHSFLAILGVVVKPNRSTAPRHLGQDGSRGSVVTHHGPRDQSTVQLGMD